MYLKKLEMIGFKSFYHKTVLHFEPGLTTIVGPNGCGKSNIFDAIRWVLGEQSVKSLRASDMQDVIFNGTDKKEPLSMAEVNITFDNRDRFFNIDSEELTITRRIFRSGESEYLINKTNVRLKDILDYLTGTGIGAESYSLVEQGKIDLILSSRPEDRRLIFDEASGITKYKSQKKEAQRKLEETENNLLRLNDIINEVKKQFTSLEKQANRAKRYKELFDELKNKEVLLAKYEITNIKNDKEKLDLELSHIEENIKELSLLINNLENETVKHQEKLQEIQADIKNIESKIVDLDNLCLRHQQNIEFNLKRLEELEKSREILENQQSIVQERFVQNQQKLEDFKREYQNLNLQIEDRNNLLKQKDAQFKNLLSLLEESLNKISSLKREILDLTTNISKLKNQVNEINSEKNVLLSRKKRLEIEAIKIKQDRAEKENDLRNIENEIRTLEDDSSKQKNRYNELKTELDMQNNFLKETAKEIENLEKKYLSLISQKEFIQKFNLTYQNITESLNAVVYLDKLPNESVDGLFITTEELREAKEEIPDLKEMQFLIKGKAKPINLDIKRIEEKIQEVKIERERTESKQEQITKNIDRLNSLLKETQDSIFNLDIQLANKKSIQESLLSQLNKIKEHEEIVSQEILEVKEELLKLEKIIEDKENEIKTLQDLETQKQALLSEEETKITCYTEQKEKLIVEISSVHTEIEGLKNQLNSYEETLKILESNYRQTEQMLEDIKIQSGELENKKRLLFEENEKLQEEIKRIKSESEALSYSLKEKNNDYQVAINSLNDKNLYLQVRRRELEELKNKLHLIEMQDKDLDYKILNIKERIMQGYKIDLETIMDTDLEFDYNVLSSEIKELKDKIDNFGTVNLVAIEEYDELKKRYDFLIQQQNDLLSAKASLQEAISKINRTAKKLFLETLQRIRTEFSNYFRLLFGGGDAQILLIDEEDPLESGIEIICRPPGKKLQNVLLLSGGEKALSAIALIFAIFKVKPSPFCILDEIDAALDEANVDRVARLLQEFSKTSQFIVITHNKKTIANADVMYGITMQEQGISKIVSVKFSSHKAKMDLEKEVVEV